MAKVQTNSSRAVAVITGSSSGLGLALAHELGKQGLKLVLAARDAQQLAAAKQELLTKQSVANSDDIPTVPCDVSDKRQAAALIEAAYVNFAGVIEVGPVEDQTIEAFETGMPDLLCRWMS